MNEYHLRRQLGKFSADPGFAELQSSYGRIREEVRKRGGGGGAGIAHVKVENNSILAAS